MQNLIDAIIKRLEDKVPELKKVDVFNSQFEAIERQEQTPFDFPCAFVEIEPFEWVQRLDGIKFADLRINVHVGVETYVDINSNLYEVVDKVSEALTRYSVKNCFSPLYAEDEQPDPDHDNFIDYQIVYKTRYIDYSGWRNKNKIGFDSSKLGVGIKVDPPEFDAPEVVVEGDNYNP